MVWGLWWMFFAGIILIQFLALWNETYWEFEENMWKISYFITYMTVENLNPCLIRHAYIGSSLYACFINLFSLCSVTSTVGPIDRHVYHLRMDPLWYCISRFSVFFFDYFSLFINELSKRLFLFWYCKFPITEICLLLQ